MHFSALIPLILSFTQCLVANPLRINIDINDQDDDPARLISKLDDVEAPSEYIYFEIEPVEDGEDTSEPQSQSFAHKPVAESIDISIDIQDHERHSSLSSSLVDLDGPAPPQFQLRAIPPAGPLPPFPPLFFGLSPKSKPQLTLQESPTPFHLQDNKLQILNFPPPPLIVSDSGEDFLVAVPDNGDSTPFGWTTKDSQRGLTLAPSVNGQVNVPFIFVEFFGLDVVPTVCDQGRRPCAGIPIALAMEPFASDAVDAVDSTAAGEDSFVAEL